ncbi:MAG: hypothetical protein P4L90_25920 [Rhodopila sp.]|nr:hypothetical protein [Rhodopila sp.]
MSDAASNNDPHSEFGRRKQSRFHRLCLINAEAEFFGHDVRPPLRNGGALPAIVQHAAREMGLEY